MANHTLRGYQLPDPGVVEMYRLTVQQGGIEALDHLLNGKYPREQLYIAYGPHKCVVGTKQQFWDFIFHPGYMHFICEWEDFLEEEGLTEEECDYEDYLDTLDRDHEFGVLVKKIDIDELPENIDFWIEDDPRLHWVDEIGF